MLEMERNTDSIKVNLKKKEVKFREKSAYIRFYYDSHWRGIGEGGDYLVKIRRKGETVLQLE
jgi:hypothetical protein